MSIEGEVALAIIATALFLLNNPSPKSRRRSHAVRKVVRRIRRRGSLSADYHRYIDGPEWRRVSSLARDRAGHRCEQRGRLFDRCNERFGLQTHHKNYKQFGFEWTARVTPPAWIRPRWEKAGRPATQGECLIVLCRKHHGAADAKRRRRGG